MSCAFRDYRILDMSIGFCILAPKGGKLMPNINDFLCDHVTLEIESPDRIYLNGHIPTMQLPGQWISFLVAHRKQKIPLPALLNQMTQNFVQDIKRYAGNSL